MLRRALRHGHASRHVFPEKQPPWSVQRQSDALATRRVGQDVRFHGLNTLPKSVATAAFRLQAAQADGQDLRAAACYRVAQNLGRWIVRGAEKQAA